MAQSYFFKHKIMWDLDDKVLDEINEEIDKEQELDAPSRCISNILNFSKSLKATTTRSMGVLLQVRN